MKVIITGTTGMVGEGVMMECLERPEVSGILSVSRRPNGRSHPKMKEYIVRNFLDITQGDAELEGFDACFFCAGVSSIGMSEADYTRNTFETTVHFGKVLAALNPGMTFIYVSGAGTDSTEKGRLMWARVKGRTENTLSGLAFRKVYHFRPGFMKAVPGQFHTLKAYRYFKWMYPFLKLVAPNSASTLRDVATAMIRCAETDIDKKVITAKDINQLGSKK